MEKPKSITQLSKEQLEDMCLNLMHVDKVKTEMIKRLESCIDEAIDHLKNDDNIIDIFFKHDFRKQNDYNPLTGEDYCPVRCVELYGYDELLEKLERGKE